MRLLLSIPQHPFDPASGAARSMRTICEMLAAEGFAVSAVATTAVEYQANGHEPKHLETSGPSRTDSPLPRRTRRSHHRHDQ